MSAGEIAEVADADEASGQHMLAEAAQELGSGESHDALLIAVSIVFPSKAHAVTIEAEQALIADGDAVSVAAEIAQHVRRSRQKRAWRRPPNLALATCARGWKRSRVDADGVPRCRRSRNLPRKTRLRTLTGRKKGYLG